MYCFRYKEQCAVDIVFLSSKTTVPCKNPNTELFAPPCTYLVSKNKRHGQQKKYLSNFRKVVFLAQMVVAGRRIKIMLFWHFKRQLKSNNLKVCILSSDGSAGLLFSYKNQCFVLFIII